MTDDLQVAIPYLAWLKKKFDKSKTPLPMKTMMRRTLNTACSIIGSIEGIPFSKISYAVYFFCKDMPTQEFARLYESQIELAGANPERFVKQLHKFYNDISAKIKKENLYSTFFAFLAASIRIRNTTEFDAAATEVINCYQCLLLQNLEYLRPNKFDFSTVICGLATDGETILTARDFLPNLDSPSYDIEEMQMTGKVKSLAELERQVKPTFAKYGIHADDLDAVHRLNSMDRIFSNHIAALLPYINEYTYDIVPTKIFSAYATPFMGLKCMTDIDSLTDLLKSHRCKTLPGNGLLVTLTGIPLIKSLLLREILYDNTICMLYRAETSEGDLSGSYDTKSGFFFSVLSEASDKGLAAELKKFVLYIYACATTKHGQEMLKQLPNCTLYMNTALSRDNMDISYPTAEMYLRGGKLRNTYKDDLNDDSAHRSPRKGNDAYSYEEKAIQGLIRKLQPGYHASEQAIELATSLGYELEDDETYVQPFIKQVLKLKIRQN